MQLMGTVCGWRDQFAETVCIGINRTLRTFRLLYERHITASFDLKHRQ